MRMSSDQLTSREYEEYNQQKEMFELGAAHSEKLKDKEIELAKIEAKWSSWLRIPITIIKLPVFFVFGIAFCIAQITKQKMPDEFWQLLTK